MAASVKKPRGEVGSRYVENLPLRGDHWTAELLDVHGRFAMSAKRRQRPVPFPNLRLMPPADKLSKVLSFVQLGTSKMLIISIPNREWRARQDSNL
jgi:hypothetical protein